MENKKITLFLIGSFIITVLLPLFLILALNRPEKKTPTPTLPPTPTLVIPITRAPQGKISLNGVIMNDFTRAPKYTDNKNDVFFVETEQYHIAYLAPFNKFLISILATPFEENRIRAEEDFLRTLGLTEQEACKLTVEVTMPGYVDPEYTGRIFPLRFCQ